MASSSCSARCSTSTNRHGVVWCGAGAVSAAATARRTAPGRPARRVNARTVRRSASVARCSASAVPSRNQSCAAGRTSAAAPRPSSRQREPAHDRDRDALGLALHELGGRGELVGDGDLGHLEDGAVGVAGAAGVAHRARARRRRWPGRPGRPARPGPSCRRRRRRRVRPVSGLEVGAESRGAERSGSSGSRAISSARTLLASTPAAASTRPVRVCAIVVVPAARDDAGGLGLDRREPGRPRGPRRRAAAAPPPC